MIGLIIVGVIIVAAVIAYGLHKKGQAVTAGNVAAVAEADAKADAAKVEADLKADVANTVSKSL